MLLPLPHRHRNDIPLRPSLASTSSCPASPGCEHSPLPCFHIAAFSHPLALPSRLSVSNTNSPYHTTPPASATAHLPPRRRRAYLPPPRSAPSIVVSSTFLSPSTLVRSQAAPNIRTAAPPHRRPARNGPPLVLRYHAAPPSPPSLPSSPPNLSYYVAIASSVPPPLSSSLRPSPIRYRPVSYACNPREGLIARLGGSSSRRRASAAVARCVSPSSSRSPFSRFGPGFSFFPIRPLYVDAFLVGLCILLSPPLDVSLSSRVPSLARSPASVTLIGR